MGSVSLRMPRRYRLQFEQLETRLVLSGYQPTAAEQQFLELLNDARANPAAYGASVGVDLSYIAPSQPLAWDPRLIEAAYLHSLDMSNRAYFSHNTPEGVDPGGRLTSAGYPWNTWGESIAAGYSLAQPAAALSELIIDAGVPDLGHRNHLLSNGSAYALQNQVGVGVVQNGVGPYVNYYTIDTAGSPQSPGPFLTGVVFNDLNGNGKYDPGEGLGGVTITVAGVGSVSTFDSGGYSLAVGPGTYTVTASGGALNFPVTRTVTVGSSNYRLNFNPVPFSAAQIQTWVSHLYRDVLHRTGTTGEVTYWVNMVEAGTSLDAVVGAFVHSAEYARDVVTNLYQQYLHRAPDAGGLRFFVTALENGVNETIVRQALLNSTEYWVDHGGTAAGFVQGLYNDLLGWTPANHEADGWIQMAAGGDRADVVNGILGSSEYAGDLIDSMFLAYLRRRSDAGGISYFTQVWHNTSEQTVLAILLESPEYLSLS